MITENTKRLQACTRLEDDQIYCPGLTPGEGTGEVYHLGKEQELALLFLGLYGYTSLIEENNSYDALFVARHFLEESAKTVRIHGGQIVEVAGDCIYAAFGGQTAPDVAVQSAHAAAITILSLLDSFNEKHLTGGRSAVAEAGIGIHKGKVIVGLSDLTGKEQMAIMGPAVNVAAGIQAETKTLNNNLLISADACRLLHQKCRRYSAAELNLRGIPQPVKVYLLGKPYETASGPVPPVQQDLSFYMAIAG
ncbi:adenylate/guanylate cyclase domain-containing protein [Mucilaginibacter pedocola]|uniref:Guanylate cyclase domain-containing protein n=1 Tax=Mucilaginibacter pedocola TaxID=1792845 RepID=A0A1S9PA17_9SPHI|nr:adenylate/guanylate cyclase domain-containing protein [Mucilaginibacter pedocola]OOQ57810.1 hypothetical protein BC343_13590 [Mucilaginibacter pedocola]